MNLDSRRNTLVEGSIWKKLILFALPVFFGNVFQQLYNTIDSLIVGQFLGDQALAAVSSSGNLIFMFVGFFNGVAMGAGVIIARYYGARDDKAMEKAIHTDVAFGLWTGVVLTVLGVVFTPTVLRWMGTPPDVLPSSISYFRLYFCGATFTVMYNIFVGILHAMGDSRNPLIYLIISSIVNVILDLLFVAVFHMGVGSAALATTISQGLSALLCCIRMMRMQGAGKLVLRKIRIDWPSLKSIIYFGLPSGIQNSVIGLANVVVQSNINAFGTAAMAGCGAYSKLEGFAFLGGQTGAAEDPHRLAQSEVHHLLRSAFRHPEQRHRSCQCGGAVQHQCLRHGGYGGLRCILQAGGLCIPAYHLLCSGVGYICGAESGRPQV